MEIQLKRINDDFHFEAVNERGNTAYLDASPDIGGANLAPRPTEMVMMGLGGCSAIDMIMILRKQRIEPSDFRVKIHAERAKDQTPALFTNIHIQYFLKDADLDKAYKAAQLSIEKYCTVAKILDKTATITYEVLPL